MANTNDPQFGRPAEPNPSDTFRDPLQSPDAPGIADSGDLGQGSAEPVVDPVSGRPVFGTSNEPFEPQAPGLSGQDDDESAAKQEAQRLAGDAGDRAKDVAGTAQEEASHVAATAKQAGGDVVDTTKREAAHVVDEAKAQGRHLLDESLDELRTQADQGQHRIAGIVRSLSDELQSMSSNATEQGVMVDLVENVQHYGRDIADFLDDNRPEDVLNSVRRYAARNPWTFMAISAGVGFVAARFLRGLNRDDSDDQGAVGSGGRYGYPSTGYSSAGYGGTGYTGTGVPGGPVPAVGQTSHADPLQGVDPHSRPLASDPTGEEELRREYGTAVGDDEQQGGGLR